MTCLFDLFMPLRLIVFTFSNAQQKKWNEENLNYSLSSSIRVQLGKITAWRTSYRMYFYAYAVALDDYSKQWHRFSMKCNEKLLPVNASSFIYRNMHNHDDLAVIHETMTFFFLIDELMHRMRSISDDVYL